MTTFITGWKKKKNEENQPIFERSYLRNTWRDLVEIWNVRWWRWLAFPLQKLFGFAKVSQSYVYVKIALLFFLLISHGCGALTSWGARHTTVCLDIETSTNLASGQLLLVCTFTMYWRQNMYLTTGHGTFKKSLASQCGSSHCLAWLHSA